MARESHRSQCYQLDLMIINLSIFINIYLSRFPQEKACFVFEGAIERDEYFNIDFDLKQSNGKRLFLMYLERIEDSNY